MGVVIHISERRERRQKEGGSNSGSTSYSFPSNCLSHDQRNQNKRGQGLQIARAVPEELQKDEASQLLDKAATLLADLGEHEARIGWIIEDCIDLLEEPESFFKHSHANKDDL